MPLVLKITMLDVSQNFPRKGGNQHFRVGTVCQLPITVPGPVPATCVIQVQLEVSLKVTELKSGFDVSHLSQTLMLSILVPSDGSRVYQLEGPHHRRAQQGYIMLTIYLICS